MSWKLKGSLALGMVAALLVADVALAGALRLRTQTFASKALAARSDWVDLGEVQHFLAEPAGVVVTANVALRGSIRPHFEESAYVEGQVRLTIYQVTPVPGVDSQRVVVAEDIVPYKLRYMVSPNQDGGNLLLSMPISITTAAENLPADRQYSAVLSVKNEASRTAFYGGRLTLQVVPNAP